MKHKREKGERSCRFCGMEIGDFDAQCDSRVDSFHETLDKVIARIKKYKLQNILVLGNDIELDNYMIALLEMQLKGIHFMYKKPMTEVDMLVLLNKEENFRLADDSPIESFHLMSCVI